MADYDATQENFAGQGSSSSSTISSTTSWMQQHSNEDDLLDTIQRLKEQQKEQRLERKALTKSIRNATKRKGRLLKKAKELTNEDLIEVMRFRVRKAAVPDSAESCREAKKPKDTDSSRVEESQENHDA